MDKKSEFSWQISGANKSNSLLLSKNSVFPKSSASKLGWPKNGAAALARGDCMFSINPTGAKK